MKTKMFSSILIIMTIAFLVTLFLYFTQLFQAGIAIKQLDFAIKQPTYFPYKETKSEATILKNGIYETINIVYSNGDPKQTIVLQVTDEFIEPSRFADKIKLENGAEAIHLGSDVFHPPNNNYPVPNFVKQPDGSSTVLYWDQDGLHYSLYGMSYHELIKIANSLK